MKQGMLNKITYPTKGYTKFNFEPHQFLPSSDFGDYIIEASDIVYNSASGNYQENYMGSTTVNSRGAGLRIEEIISYDNDSRFVSRKKFSYEGGKLLEPINFWRIERYLSTQPNSSSTTDNIDVNYYHIWTGSGTNYSQSFLIPNPIGYNTVVVKNSNTETNQANEKINGSSVYQFHNEESSYNPQVGRVSYSYLSNKNGLLRNVEQRNGSNGVVQSTQYNYQRIEQSDFLSISAKIIAPVNGSDGLIRLEYTLLKSDWWKQSEITETLDGVVTAKSYQYSDDGWGNVTSTSTTNSNKKEYQTRFQYPNDFSGGAANTYGSNLLRDNHMYRQVLEQTTTVGSTPTQKVTTTYSNPNGSGNIVPTLIKNYPTSTTEAVSTSYQYDNRGNVRQVLGQDGVPTAFIWGYNQTLPVAKVVGATFSEIEDVLSDNFHAGSEGLSDTQLRDLRRELSNAQITTYTHDPLVGITSETDPNGRKMIYHYDDLNRLQWIESQEGHVVQKMEYQYAQP